MKHITIGIAGFAHGHVSTYCTKISEFEDAKVTCAWDHDDARLQNRAEAFGLKQYKNLADLLADSSIDAIIVGSETNRHADIIEAVCAAGRNILCQKPMAMNAVECDRVIKAVEDSGVHFEMAFQMRCDPMNLQIKKWIDEGALGNIGSLRRRHCINFLWDPSVKNSWHVDGAQNVGMFFDDAVHAADFLYWIMGKPVSVMAEIDNILTDVAPDDTGIAIYRWQDGPMGVLFNSSITLASENTCEIYGSEGTIIQNYGDQVSTAHAPVGEAPLKLFRKSTGEWEKVHFEVPASQGERIADVPRGWIDRLKNNQPPIANAVDGKVSIAMCQAAYESAQSGSRIDIGKYF
ncbi:MAG: Gfo/Idh/MocA family oxidoreductase [Abditibacteriaceae bacterium]